MLLRRVQLSRTNSFPKWRAHEIFRGNRIFGSVRHAAHWPYGIKTHCSKKWKLLVFNAVITSKVLYGLETLEPTEAAGRLLNTFQLKGLRKILKLHTTFVQRDNSNEYVHRRANETINSPSVGPGRQIKPLTEILEDRRLKLLGHVLRRDRQHPLHQAAFSTRSALPREPNTEDEAAHDNSGQLTIWIKHGK